MVMTAIGAALLAACSMAPAYQPPATVAPPQFKEMAGWTPATPMDTMARGPWWKAYGDPVLDDLEAGAQAASPTLAAALARHDAALAQAGAARSDLFPQVAGEASVERARVSAHAPGNTTGQPAMATDQLVGASLSYELDLWGRVRNQVRATHAEADAAGDDLASARLSLQASVADAYARLRGLDAQAALLRDTVTAYDRAYNLTRTRHAGGVSSGIDENRARTTLSSARAQISAVASQRAATEHEIAALVGALASDFAIAPRVEAMPAPATPPGAPSQLLQRRPDVAAAERRLYAANARIGVARAAWFPTITLDASGGWQTTHGALFTVPNSFWGLGPAAAVLSLFDGGRRHAEVRLSRAQYDEMAAQYRQSVLTAFREVEDGLAALHHLSAQAVDERDAADAADRTRALALTRYRDGASDYLEVVIAQTDALAARRALIEIETERVRSSIALVRALGGGFEGA
jgi:multidrug efflux system outer membrane protein